MTEQKKKVARRSRKASVAPSASKEATISPVVEEVKAEQVIEPVPAEPKQEAEAPSIKPTKEKGVATDKRFTKIVAVKTCSGRYGNIRFDIVEAETYTLDRNVAAWLIRNGKAKEY